MTLRGVEFVAAVTLVAELGDLRRFEHPKRLMSYLGLVPSEYSTGESRVQGKITKTGNSHARRILIESAWAYRLPARMSRELVVRNEGQSKAVRDIAWRAQLRLCSRFRRLQVRGVHHNKACAAIARELAGFIWDIARQAATDPLSHRAQRKHKVQPHATHSLPISNATREHDEGNPRTFYVGIYAMTPDPRSRQPRDGPMKCGNQPADIRMIHRRQVPRASRS